LELLFFAAAAASEPEEPGQADAGLPMDEASSGCTLTRMDA